jgi:hypothetical protein
MKADTAAVSRRRPGRPRSKQSEEAILKATGKLLANEGYFGLTVSKVAERSAIRRWARCSIRCCSGASIQPGSS